MPKGEVTSKSIEDLLSQFKPHAEQGPTPAALERQRRSDAVRSTVSDLANTIAELADGTSDVDNLKQALVSLNTAQSRSLKSIASIPDSALTPADEPAPDAAPVETPASAKSGK